MTLTTMTKSSFGRAALGVLFVSLFAAACATRPAYRPRLDGERVGYTDERISENRARISYSGSDRTTRRRVEDYLLLRAAEVTQNSGFVAFVFDDRNTETERSYYRTDFATFGAWPYWRRFGPFSYYYSSWHFRDPFNDTIESQTRYSAYAEIVMLTAAQAERETRAISAADVISRLRPPEPPPPPAPRG
jgi:hypothetical protein